MSGHDSCMLLCPEHCVVLKAVVICAHKRYQGCKVRDPVPGQHQDCCCLGGHCF